MSDSPSVAGGFFVAGEDEFSPDVFGTERLGEHPVAAAESKNKKCRRSIGLRELEADASIANKALEKKIDFVPVFGSLSDFLLTLRTPISLTTLWTWILSAKGNERRSLARRTTGKLQFLKLAVGLPGILTILPYR